MRDDDRKPGACADDSGSGTTIVGGQPPGRPRRALQDVPVGLERVLFLAATDAGFRQALLRKRDAAADERGLPLLESERTALKVASPGQLEAAIRGLDVSAPSLERRGFMRSVAASAVTLAAVNALSGCSDLTPIAIAGVGDGRIGVDAGVRVRDRGPELTLDIPRAYPDAGARRDVPPIRPEAGSDAPNEAGRGDGTKPGDK
jgi:hypothetical protein